MSARRKSSLVLLIAGVAAVIWFAVGLPPLPWPAIYGIGEGHLRTTVITPGFYGVMAALVVILWAVLGLLATIGD